MSAYILEPRDIAILAAQAATPRNHFDTIVNPIKKTRTVVKNPAEDFARILIEQNIRSVEARYPNYGEAGGLLNCSSEEYIEECVQAAKNFRAYIPPHKIVKLCGTYSYQACETDDYYETDAFWYITRIKGSAAYDLADALDQEEAA